ncbi:MULTISPECIES: type II toxin-antitoxin system RelE family toxin [Streptomyces]|uniref:mRNA-degrading endonuclease RelE, toxin component of the RelBE toxin-antitoxin system n=1 Tax=Streptomyces pini TaxID=1520580 RepID=A0A1I4KMI7_9ACTN|nr:type II toxin-antitoxin system RelE/ParE family toxin [Streptomyces pini]SFL79779.1 mRNA-degrading endonuclease RelE, toxin component of the RelBE toxin-antitoxin system [Streptomyces pini]
MTWQVLWEPTALDTATGHLRKDPGSVDALLMATDQLAENPRPPESRPWGTEHRRLRHGPWRVLYRIDQDARTLHIEHIGRTSD